jgi:energy-coupling factor transporter ATP-binding protein EcfA2
MNSDLNKTQWLTAYALHPNKKTFVALGLVANPAYQPGPDDAPDWKPVPEVAAQRYANVDDEERFMPSSDAEAAAEASCNGETEQMHEDSATKPRSNRDSRQQQKTTNKLEPLNFKRLREVFAMQFDDADFVLRNGYLAKGEMVAIFGAGGIGKTRIVNQLIRDIKIGKPFLGRWQTNGRDLKIMVLQTENSCRRMKSDLWAQCGGLSEEEIDCIDKDVWWHTLENSDDSFLTLASAENQQRIDDACAQYKPDLIVWDVLRDFVVDDPNSDRDMQATLSIIGRLTRKYNPQCIAIVIAHARTGRAGAASTLGYDRANFGRGSKVLFSWVRAQINIAAYTPDNKTLIIASGKCNNAEEFKPFPVTLDVETMSYEVDETISDEEIEAWHEEMGAASGIKKKKEQKKSPEQIKKIIIELVQKAEEETATATIPKSILLTLAAEKVARDDARDYLKILVREKRLFEGRVKEGKARSEVHISTQEIIEPAVEPKKGKKSVKGTKKSKKAAHQEQPEQHDEQPAE